MRRLNPLRATHALTAIATGLTFALASASPVAHAQAKRVQTPYQQPKAVFDFYLDHPDKIGAALFWLRSFMNPLTDAPYSLLPEDMSVVVVIHGTELVTLARKNEARYADAVQRMRYYASLGVKFRVCGLALSDFGYRVDELQDFVEVAPSAMTELVHWQNQGHGLITPVVTEKKVATEDIR